MNQQEINNNGNNRSLLDKDLLLAQIQLTNRIYIANTFVRTIGTLMATTLLKRVSDHLSFELQSKFWQALQLAKSIFHLLGLAQAYIKTAVEEDSNWVTRSWLQGSIVAYTMMSVFYLTIDMPFFKERRNLLAGLFVISQLYYYWEKGRRDAIRPLNYSNLGKNLFAHGREVSDFQKNILNARKISTSVAEAVGSLVVTLIYKRVSMIHLGLIAILVNVFAYGLYDSKINYKLTDPSLGDQGKLFPIELRKWFLSLPDNTFKGIRNLSDRNSPAWKLSAFISTFSAIKLSGLDKNYVLAVASGCSNYDNQFVLQAKSISNLINLTWDIFKIWYRERKGQHIFSSLQMITITSFMSLLATFSLQLVKKQGNCIPIIVGIYPIVAWASSNTISSLLHLFEVWGLEEKGESSLFKSFRLNFISISLEVMAKPIFFLTQSMNLFFYQQCLLSGYSFITLKSLQKIASEAEKI